MGYSELKRQVQSLIDEHGAKDFLLATAAELGPIHKEVSNQIGAIWCNLDKE